MSDLARPIEPTAWQGPSVAPLVPEQPQRDNSKCRSSQATTCIGHIGGVALLVRGFANGTLMSFALAVAGFAIGSVLAGLSGPDLNTY